MRVATFNRNRKFW